MTPKQDYALIKLNEEAGEIVQAKSKLDLWGPDSYKPHDPTQRLNIELLEDECGDMLAAIEYAIECRLFDPASLALRKEAKMGKFRREGGNRS